MQTNRFPWRTLTLVATLTAGAASAVTVFAAQPATPTPTVRPLAVAISTSTTMTETTTTTTTPPTPLLTPTEADRPAHRAATLRPGDRGPRVRELQERLHSLGYWLGQRDGTYGGLTVQAVLAVQKVHGLRRDGIAGAAVFAALGTDPRPQPVHGGPDRVEVDKERQVLYVVRGDVVQWVLNVSTGTETRYWANGRSMLADTPSGRWSVTRVHDGWKRGELGSIYRPRFFHRDGIAVHGHRDVPAHPASHGCVRVSFAAMDWIWSAALMPAGSEVWVY
ncbi:MAG TPA: L,D-transpeptidase family protein [Acidimicrobiales bacterium]|nr:L,D-transpeptidase family protein [Acidimicrobiales bacterium]